MAQSIVEDYLGHPCQTTLAFNQFYYSVERARNLAQQEKREVSRQIGRALVDISERIECLLAGTQGALASLPNDDGTDHARAVLKMAEPYGSDLSDKFGDLAGLMLVALDMGGLHQAPEVNHG